MLSSSLITRNPRLRISFMRAPCCAIPSRMISGSSSALPAARASRSLSIKISVCVGLCHSPPVTAHRLSLGGTLCATAAAISHEGPTRRIAACRHGIGRDLCGLRHLTACPHERGELLLWSVVGLQRGSKLRYCWLVAFSFPCGVWTFRRDSKRLSFSRQVSPPQLLCRMGRLFTEEVHLGKNKVGFCGGMYPATGDS